MVTRYTVGKIYVDSFKSALEKISNNTFVNNFKGVIVRESKFNVTFEIHYEFGSELINLGEIYHKEKKSVILK